MYTYCYHLCFNMFCYLTQKCVWHFHCIMASLRYSWGKKNCEHSAEKSLDLLLLKLKDLHTTGAELLPSRVWVGGRGSKVISGKKIDLYKTSLCLAVLFLLTLSFTPSSLRVLLQSWFLLLAIKLFLVVVFFLALKLFLRPFQWFCCWRHIVWLLSLLTVSLLGFPSDLLYRSL